MPKKADQALSIRLAPNALRPYSVPPVNVTNPYRQPL